MPTLGKIGIVRHCKVTKLDPLYAVEFGEKLLGGHPDRIL